MYEGDFSGGGYSGSRGISCLMDLRVVKFNPLRVPAHLIDRVVDLLMKGGVIGYPTETVYGLGGDAENGDVVDRIYRLKGRGSQKPILVLVAEKEDVNPIVRTVSQKAKILMDRYWPGPLTLVFEASSVLPRALTGEKKKIGIRISPDPLCQALLERFRKPLLSTSGNPAGKEPARSALEVLSYFGDGVDLILDGGGRRSGIPSTVLDVSGDPPRFLRIGAIQKDEIERVMGELNEVEDV